MSTALRGIAVAVTSAALLAVPATTASAKPAPPGPGNSAAAKACQKGGWQTLTRTDGTTFATQGACVSYAAKGGVLTPKPAAPNPLELQKVTSGPAVPGASFDFTIAVGNIGGCTLTNVRVTDTLTAPAGTTITSTEPTSTVTPTAGGFQITFPDVGPIPPNGRVTLRIRVQVPAGAPAGTRYDDTASVVADCNGSTSTRSTALAEPTVEPTAPSSACAISGSAKSASHTEVVAGEQFAYFVNLYNSGSQPCTGTTITDALDPRLTFVSCSDGCLAAGQTLSWAVGALDPGQSITVRVIAQVRADATGTLPNTARADTAETPPHDMTTPGPAITGRSVLAPNAPATTPDRVR